MEQRMRLFGRALLIQLGLYLVLSFLMGSMPSEAYAEPIVRLIFKMLVFFPPIAYYSRSTGYRPFSNTGKRNISIWGWIFRYIFGLSATVTVMNLFGFVTSYFLGKGDRLVFENSSEAAWGFVISVILASILEEILFRGAFFHASEGQNVVARIALGATFFALMHCSLSQFLYAFAAGIVISLFFFETKSILFAIMLHFGANFLTWLFAFIGAFTDTSFLETVFAIVFAITAVLGIVILLLKYKKAPVTSNAEKFVYIGAEGTIYAAAAIILTVLS